VLEVIELVGTVTLESVLVLVTVGLEADENVDEDVIEVRYWVELVENVEWETDEIQVALLVCDDVEGWCLGQVLNLKILL
jgi:hypothetical protein